MPGKGDDVADDGYRTEFGTSIACRLDPTKERGEFDLVSLLKQSLFCPVVPVQFEGDIIGGNFKNLIETPWCVRETLNLSHEQLRRISEVIRWPLGVADIFVDVVPIDLTGNTASDDLRGQAIFFKLGFSTTFGMIQRMLDTPIDSAVSFRLEINNWTIQLSVRAKFSERGIAEIQDRARGIPDKSLRKKIVDWCDETRLAMRSHSSRDARDPTYDREVEVDLSQSGIILSAEDRAVFRGADNLAVMHNGIRIPTHWADADWPSNKINLAPERQLGTAAIAAIGLQDGLRPNLSLARDRVKSWPWEVTSAADMTLSRALQRLDKTAQAMAPASLLTVDSKVREYLTLGRLLSDPLLVDNGPWCEQKIFKIPSEPDYISLVEIKQKLKDGTKVRIANLQDPGELNDEYHPWGWQTAATALAAAYLNLTNVVKNYSNEIVAVDVRSKPLQEGERLFPPLSFIPYVGSNILRSYRPYLNSNHPFAKWLIEKTPLIAGQYPGILEMIRSKLLTRSLYGGEKEKVLESVNGAVDRLSQLDAAFTLPRRARLTEADFDT
jgi:hypothetical protein